MDHLNHHDSWVLFGVAGAITLALIAYVINFRGVAYKISVRGMGPEHRHYRLGVAWNRGVSALFAVIGAFLTAKGLRSALG
ncbi:hypothetical protein [Kitasatospora nipponensis]|uniref:hypothetical protein n=1 Tax=Kitasatospora nipponensis TaxID=258049 RepID=UPI0031D09A49